MLRQIWNANSSNLLRATESQFISEEVESWKTCTHTCVRNDRRLHNRELCRGAVWFYPSNTGEFLIYPHFIGNAPESEWSSVELWDRKCHFDGVIFFFWWRHGNSHSKASMMWGIQPPKSITFNHHEQLLLIHKGFCCGFTDTPTVFFCLGTTAVSFCKSLMDQSACITISYLVTNANASVSIATFPAAQQISADTHTLQNSSCWGRTAQWHLTDWIVKTYMLWPPFILAFLSRCDAGVWN